MTMNTSMLKENDVYRCADLALATVLALHFPIEGIDKESPRKAQFLFLRTQELEEAVEGYWKGILQVEPQKFFNQLKAIKARLYSEE
jgi:hypothetical protein